MKFFLTMLPFFISFIGLFGMSIRKLFYFTDMTNSRYFLENWIILVILIGINFVYGIWLEFKKK